MVHCIGSLRVGGTEGQLTELIARLPRERFEQTLVLLRGEGPLIERVREAGCEVIDLGLTRRAGPLDSRPLFSLAAAFFRFVSLLRRRRPQILHAWLSHANRLSVPAGRLAGVPVILTSQRQLSNYKQGRPLLRAAENWTNRRARAVLVNSDAIRRDLIEKDGLDPERIVRIYNGVALERFGDPAAAATESKRRATRRELGLEDGDVALIVVANLHPYKGHELVLTAMAALRQKYPSLQALFIGRDQGCVERLKSMARELGLGGAVMFLGERADIPELLAAADIAVHTPGEEGFSNSILEAMAAGRPLVATRVGGNVEQVADQETGLLVPVGDGPALAAALEQLVADAALRQRMGAAARARIEREFSFDRVVRDYTAWYESLLGARTPSSASVTTHQSAPPSPDKAGNRQPATGNYSADEAVRAPRKIRLVHCIGTMNIGGAEGQIAELIARLPRDRFEQMLVLTEGGGPLIERVREAGCLVVELGYIQQYRKFDPRCWAALGGALGRYARVLREFRPDVLHAQLYWANILSVAAGRLARVPVIVTSRLQLSDYKFGRPWMQRLENLANRYTTAVFANSEAVRRDALTYEKLDPRLVRVIHNGVVLERFENADPAPLRQRYAIRPGELVITAIANLHRYKGHDDLLRAIAMLIGKYPHLRVLLPGRDQGMRARLEALIGELGLAEKVQLIGQIQNVPDLLALADIVVHPSHEEGFSNSVLEGMTAGRPLVVTDVGGNPEAVRDGVDGFIVPPRDPAALAAALETLIVNPELRRAMGAAARRRIEEEFSMERLIERFAAWYEELVKQATPK